MVLVVKSARKMMEREMAKAMLYNQKVLIADKLKMDWYITGWKQKTIYMVAMFNLLFTIGYWGYKIMWGGV